MLDAVEVFEQIERAVRTTRRLPPVTVRSRFCNWPDYIHDYHAGYDPSTPDKSVTEPPIRLIPNARQLSELDAVIRWLAWLSKYGEEYPHIVWDRAADRSWRNIAVRVGRDPRTCKERFRIGIAAIYYAIEEGKLK
jgi:hypothetical protein